MNNAIFENRVCALRPKLTQFAIKFTQNLDDAEDLVQDTLIKAIRYESMFEEGTNLQGWLYTILRNTFLNNYRRLVRQRGVVETTEDLSSYQLTKSAANNKGENKFIQEDVTKALNQLEPEYYIPFTRYFEGYKYHEIADEMQIPIGTVKTRIHMARKFLKASLKMYTAA
jgi:RNA polymerase sigma factor (sigma-70 family)